MTVGVAAADTGHGAWGADTGSLLQLQLLSLQLLFTQHITNSSAWRDTTTMLELQPETYDK